MKKYLSVVMIILLVSCKQGNGNLNSKNDTIKSAQIEEKLVDEKIDYDAIWSEASSKIDSDFTYNFESISNTFKEFIPNGFSVSSFAIGDANLDGLSDTMLILKNDSETDLTTLLLILKQKNGENKLALRNENTLGGDSNTVIIDNGRIFLFEQNNASVDIYFYKFDKATENWTLMENFSSGLDGNGNVTKAEEIISLEN